MGETQSLLKYGAPLIGELIEWPLEQMPQEVWPDMAMEFIPYMAQSFDADKYPLLAQLHPMHVLPADMRGYVPRGYDNARGIDTGRVLMSPQEDAIRNITGELGQLNDRINTGLTKGAFSSVRGYSTAAGLGGGGAGKIVTFEAGAVVPTADENRVKNVAWNMIVRAK